MWVKTLAALVTSLGNPERRNEARMI